MKNVFFKMRIAKTIEIDTIAIEFPVHFPCQNNSALFFGFFIEDKQRVCLSWKIVDHSP
ncbi:5178_t:CDS:2 [Ambispora gerdemannii]|uniref:5178_t:CDS:1 n=1 Tax=Ambispora gerdemannii TaxID=144530 RepID=A0A9N9A5F6_9GLOM|nr:5178_t:CDS:2 [Ambispora gerdemannii]